MQQGFTPARSTTGRDLQQMLKSRPDILRLIGFAERGVLEQVMICLEDRHDFAQALHRISGDWQAAPAQARVASEALGAAAARRQRGPA